MSNSEKVIEREHYDAMRIKLQTQIDELEARVSRLQAQVDLMYTPKEYEEYGKGKYEEGLLKILNEQGLLKGKVNGLISDLRYDIHQVINNTLKKQEEA